MSYVLLLREPVRDSRGKSKKVSPWRTCGLRAKIAFLKLSQLQHTVLPSTLAYDTADHAVCRREC